MSPLQVALDEYLAVRRTLGYKLRLSGRLLQRFVDFADRQGATYITSELAAAWATLPGAAQPAQWANRLGMVRRFALYCSAQEPAAISDEILEVLRSVVADRRGATIQELCDEFERRTGIKVCTVCAR